MLDGVVMRLTKNVDTKPISECKLPRSGLLEQGKCTRTAKSAAPSSLFFLPPVICGVEAVEKAHDLCLNS